MIMHIMQHVIRIRDAERQARALNLSLLDLCRRADVPYSVVRRWERGRVMPRIDTFERTTARLDAALAAARAEIIRNLSEPNKVAS